MDYALRRAQNGNIVTVNPDKRSKPAIRCCGQKRTIAARRVENHTLHFSEPVSELICCPRRQCMRRVNGA